MRVDALSPSEVHLWTIQYDRSADLALLSQCLSPVELQRARRLRVKQRRDSFVYNRALVRQILGAYAAIPPQDVPLITSPEGKPLWESSPRANARTTGCLTFNLSHCQDRAVLAVSRNRALGVDLEALNPNTNYDALARQACSAREWEVYQRLPSAEKPAAVLRIWTRKEAFLKSQGIGLARPLSAVEVTFGRSEPPQLLATGDLDQPPSEWLLESWSPQAGWFAALATPREGGSLRLRFHRATSARDWQAPPHVRAKQAACLAS